MREKQIEKAIYERALQFRSDNKCFIHLEGDITSESGHNKAINFFVGSPHLALVSIGYLLEKLALSTGNSSLELAKTLVEMEESKLN